jgi:hypothetical protein
VSASSFTPDEIRAAAEVHSELGPGYRDAVIDSFLDKVGREIDARVDARVAAGQQPAQPPAHQHQHQHRHFNGSFVVAIASLIFGIPMTAIAANAKSGAGAMVFIVWLGIALVNVAYTVGNRRSSGG